MKIMQNWIGLHSLSFILLLTGCGSGGEGSLNRSQLNTQPSSSGYESNTYTLTIDVSGQGSVLNLDNNINCRIIVAHIRLKQGPN